MTSTSMTSMSLLDAYRDSNPLPGTANKTILSVLHLVRFVVSSFLLLSLTLPSARLKSENEVEDKKCECVCVCVPDLKRKSRRKESWREPSVEIVGRVVVVLCGCCVQCDHLDVFLLCQCVTVTS